MSLNLIHILVADDDADDCQFFKEALSKSPILSNLNIVHDGENLMQLLADTNVKVPDVIFLDLNMPRKNGFECLIEIKQTKELCHIPIVIFSTSLEHKVVSTLYENGATYFIRKPSDFSLFKQIINHVLVNFILLKNLPVTTRENFVLSLTNEKIN